MTDYATLRAEAAENANDLAVERYEARQADYETDDGPYHAGLERESS